MASKYDLVKELLDYFVAPLLPLKPSPTQAPLPEQQLVATQIHAVVMLYNYYLRKQSPGVEFLCFEEFSQLAIALKPSLSAHMNLVNISDCVDVDSGVAKVSVTEKSIIDACNICVHLDASKEVPNVEGWPISGVAVLLTDLKKQYCSLQIDSTIQGVWSLIDKSLDDNCLGRKRKTVKKTSIDASNVDEAMSLQLAFEVVKETRGISSKDLEVLESHVVYSLSKAKTSVRFYIMQYNQSLGEDIRLPIKRVLKSMQGPLVEKLSSNWYVTSVVEYFHLLPYTAIITKWFSSQVNNDEQMETGFDFDFSDQEE